MAGSSDWNWPKKGVDNLLNLLNMLFHLIHLSIIFFFLLGWIFASTRIPHFILSLSILISWYGLGLFYKFGYCLITDIQWKILKQLKQEPSTEYYIKYVIDKVTGLDTDTNIVNKLTGSIYFSVFAISTILVFFA